MQPGALITPHFSRRELNYDAAPATVRANLETLARLLEDVRAALGNVPLRVTSGYRAPASNAAVAGASATSQHLDGTAADVVPVGVSLTRAMASLAASPIRQRWGQVIAYPFGTHLHIALPTRGAVGQMLVQTSPDAAKPKYMLYSAVTLAAAEQESDSRKLASGALAAATLAGAALLPPKG